MNPGGPRVNLGMGGIVIAVLKPHLGPAGYMVVYSVPAVAWRPTGGRIDDKGCCWGT